MAQTIDAALDAQHDIERPPLVEDAPALSPAAAAGHISLAVHEDFAEIEQDWRVFEAHADCTVFQSFDWLATWQHHIGDLNGTRPAIVVGRDAAGNILFIFPLSVCSGGFARKLIWLGSELCDYNSPLLSPAFAQRLDHTEFLAVWGAVIQHLQSQPRLQFDLINLTKMPEWVGAQRNPFLNLPAMVNPSGAYLTHLIGDWETFYTAKRSPANRRRDRKKRKRLAEFGEVKLINPESETEILNTLNMLMAQKERSFTRMGVGNLFARPGHAAFYRALAADPVRRHLVHVSSLNVGVAAAAINLGLTFHGCYYHLLASYDDGEVSRFGPGAAHLNELLRLASERGFRVFDFTIGDERYKRDWCDTELKLYDHISAATWRGALIAMPMQTMQRLKRWIKQTPVLWNAFSAGRALIGSWALKFHR